MVKINGQSAVVGNSFLAVRDASGKVYFAPAHIIGGGMRQLNPEEMRVLLNQTPEEFSKNFPWMTGPIDVNQINQILSDAKSYYFRPGVSKGQLNFQAGGLDINSIRYDITNSTITFIIDNHSSSGDFSMTVTPDSALDFSIWNIIKNQTVNDTVTAAFYFDSFFSRLNQMGITKIPILATRYQVPHAAKFIAPNVTTVIVLNTPP